MSPVRALGEADNVMIPVSVIWAVLLFVFILNLSTTLAILFNSPEYTGKQKLFKILFVWVLPMVGSLFVLSFRRADRAESFTIEEAKKEREWAESNESCTHF